MVQFKLIISSFEVCFFSNAIYCIHVREDEVICKSVKAVNVYFHFKSLYFIVSLLLLLCELVYFLDVLGNHVYL